MTGVMDASVTIREATGADAPRLLAMGQRFLAETPYRDLITPDEECVSRVIGQVMGSPDGVVFVSQATGGAVTGMIGVLLQAHPFSGEPTGFELVWWVDPEVRGHGIRLLRAAEEWAASHGATHMQVVAPNPRVEQLYQRLGYHAIEVAYQRRLTPCP